MKTLFSACLALAVVAAAEAQTFRPESARGGRDGGGRSEHRDGGRGRSDGDRDRGGWRGGPDHWHHFGSRPSVRIYAGGYYPSYGYYGNYGYGYGYGYYPSYPTYGRYSYYPAYGDAYPYYGGTTYSTNTSAAANGLLLGALAGGIIGHNSGDFRHNGWRGAAWGAGAGLLIGSVIDANRRVPAAREQVVVAQPVMTTAAAAPAEPVEQPTIIQRNYGPATPQAVATTPMSAANALFGRE